MKKRTGRKVITVILVVIVCMFALFPFVWMISTSFKTAGEVYSKTPSFIPKAATMQGYKEMLTTHSTTFNFMQWLGNSVIVSLLTTAFSMIIATLGGYGISRFRFRGRGFILFYINNTGTSGITVDHSIICNYGESAASGYKDWSGSSLLYILHSILYMDDEGIFRYDTNLP